MTPEIVTTGDTHGDAPVAQLPTKRAPNTALKHPNGRLPDGDAQQEEQSEQDQEDQAKKAKAEQNDKNEQLPSDEESLTQQARDNKAQEIEQKHQQLLNKVTDDPYLLLRNKMRLEYKKRRHEGAPQGVTKKW